MGVREAREAVDLAQEHLDRTGRIYSAAAARGADPVLMAALSRLQTEATDALKAARAAYDRELERLKAARLF